MAILSTGLTGCLVDLPPAVARCEIDEDCETGLQCLLSPLGDRACRPPVPRCGGESCGSAGPRTIADPDSGLERSGPAPPPDGTIEAPDTAAPSPPPLDGGPLTLEPDATPIPPPDPPPATNASAGGCPLDGPGDRVQGFEWGVICRDTSDCVYEFSSAEPASCDDFCADLGETCDQAGYNLDLDACLVMFEVRCDYPDVRNLVCFCSHP